MGESSGPEGFLASRNAKKIAEMERILDEVLPGAKVLGLDDVTTYDEPVEDQPDFVGNALLKARAGYRETGLPTVADDSGLCVEALGDRPGIFSARWALADASVSPEAGPGEIAGARDFGVAMARVHDELEALGPDASRNAHFVCALALCWPDGHCEWFEGRIDGMLAWPPRGSNGFGYDPIFVPAGHEQTFGEMDPAEKHAISHRADAFRKLVAALF